MRTALRSTRILVVATLLGVAAMSGGSSVVQAYPPGALIVTSDSQTVVRDGTLHVTITGCEPGFQTVVFRVNDVNDISYVANCDAAGTASIGVIAYFPPGVYTGTASSGGRSGTIQFTIIPSIPPPEIVSDDVGPEPTSQLPVGGSTSTVPLTAIAVMVTAMGAAMLGVVRVRRGQPSV